MKRLLFIVAAMFGCLVTLSAVEFQTYRPAQVQMSGYNPSALEVEDPEYQFTGTSVMHTGSYTVPVSALQTNSVFADEDASSLSSPRRISQRPTDNRTDPSEPPQPIGDTPWLLMALMLIGYISVKIWKKRTFSIEK